MKNVVYWFRGDLRLHDQPILKQLENREDVTLLPIYCFDERGFVKNKLGFRKTGSIRTTFLFETVNSLQRNLQHIGSDLLIAFGKTEEIVSGIAKTFNADEMYAEKEETSEEIFVETELIQRLNVPVYFHESKTLLTTCQLPFSINNVADVFTTFRKAVEPLLLSVESINAPESLPGFPDEFRSNAIVGANPGKEWMQKSITNDVTHHLLAYCDLETLAVHKRDVANYIGGEQEGLRRLFTYIWQNRSILHYKETRNALIGESYSSKLSPWLANGSVSARKIFSEIKKFEKDIEANQSTYWLVIELLWRDYFRFVVKKFGNKVFLRGGIKNRNPYCANDPELFERWRTGTTGNDFVDANMIELHKTGFMSNRGRQNAASYLCKNLGIDWRWGASWFESQLIDYDVASNWGNWMYIAGVGNDPRENRRFDVEKQAQIYDADKSYRKLWLG